MNKKFAAYFESVLMVVALFAFAYFAGFSEVKIVSAGEGGCSGYDPYLVDGECGCPYNDGAPIVSPAPPWWGQSESWWAEDACSDGDDNDCNGRIDGADPACAPGSGGYNPGDTNPNPGSSDSGTGETVDNFQEWLSGFASTGNENAYNWANYPKANNAGDLGCCFVSEGGDICGTASPESCVEDSPFMEGRLCSESGFCEKGCCYDDATGTYDKNVLKVSCSANWTNDPNCNLNSRSNLGCCILGTETIFETEGQCETDTLARGTGGGEAVNWDDDIGEAECFLLSQIQTEGACVYDEGRCSFLTEEKCASTGGNFYVDTLCTSPDLDTVCEKTDQTKCFDGKDGVYFLDSCGNRANIYDSTKADSASYWDKAVALDDSCGAGNGNAESKTCGNCNRFLGGTCAAGGDTNLGQFYCEEVGCMFDGENYKNGESWCVYDGAIGDGDDVVGSRHWKAVCSQGQVQVEPCADYRNQICIQSNEFEIGGESVDFSNAACVANNWRECLNLNEDEASQATCEDALNCKLENIDIAPNFNFNVCLPEYPAGFDFNSERSQGGADSLCGIATTNCTVVLSPKTWGGCELKKNSNKECLTEDFTQKMNDFCRGIGDCGGSVNIEGEWSDNYVLRSDSDRQKYQPTDLSSGWISKLKNLANPVPGQIAEVEDYSKYINASGILEMDPETGELGISGVAAGVGGIAYAVALLSVGTGWGSSFVSLSPAISAAESSIFTQAASTSFAGIAIAAAIGAIVGVMLAERIGASPGGAMLMAVGGAMVGVAIGAALLKMSWAAGPAGWIVAIIGIVLMIIGSLFQSDCDPIEVQFECQAWQPPVGGDDCEACNGDPLKPCSEYRCESLGAACEFINVGTDDELCIWGNPNDATPPSMTIPDNDPDTDFSYVGTPGGYRITAEDGGCLDANTYVEIGVLTSEPAQCRFDPDGSKDFDDMDFNFGRNMYLYNHTTQFLLPDPGAGESHGINWSGDLSLFVKCRDRNGNENPLPFEIEMCVFEGPDTRPPVIDTEVSTGDLLVGFDATSQNVLIVTNEMATCRWDLNDVDYYSMTNTLNCGDSYGAPSHLNGYACRGAVPVGVNESRDYYVRCEDQPWLENVSERNVNQWSYVFNIEKPVTKISIDSVLPDTDYEISTDLTTVELKIETSGGGDFHFCSYSFSGYDNMFSILEAGSERTHVIDLNVGPGKQKIYVECRDETEDFDRSFTEFEITKDSSSPAIARIWQDGGKLNIITVEDSECRYSLDGCGFIWDDAIGIGSGTDHSISVSHGETYYIKCADGFGNMPTGCSATVVAA